ncbi:VCBS domain-containing protein, partial [Chitinimonas sp. PSY-7]|uniref:VCBS domain-containing protein n=1 Tax=Chitinimonas sp. PSY-7 TaxID=3459088 RepID=UPI00404022CC
KDGTATQNIVVTINGLNDVAVIGAGAGDSNKGVVVEDTTLVSHGKLTVTDADQGQAEMVPQSVKGTYGTFTVDKDGNWQFVLNNGAKEVQGLRAGQSLTLNFAVASVDGTPSNVAITVTGTDDVPVIAG